MADKKYILMHRQTPVAEIKIDLSTGIIVGAGEAFMPRHLPVGVRFANGRINRDDLNEWWSGRCIPTGRSGSGQLAGYINTIYNGRLPLMCYGLNLSDQYWICPEDDPVKWEDINFFRHGFSDDMGNLLFGINEKEDGLDLNSPDNTTDGYLQKRWEIIGGKRCLVKGGSSFFIQQPYNEVIASRIMECLNISNVPYYIKWINGRPYSVCEDFITEDTELVPAWRVLNTQKKANHISVYSYFIDCCEKIGIKDVISFLDRMIVLDFIIANEDRHFNNFGAVRNAKTLKWIGMAPIYDSGSSLGYDKLNDELFDIGNYVCKPFKNKHMLQLELVSDFSWIDFARLSCTDSIIYDTFEEYGKLESMTDSRIRAICQSVKGRIDILREVSAERTASASFSTEGDVLRNVAENYFE